jgi:hypothetical protein
MSTDLLRVESNQRVDYTDFEYMLNESLTGIMRDIGDNFLLDPGAAAADRLSVIDGFEMSNPSGKQLTVTLGRALLAERVSGVLHYGALVATGDASQTVDMTSLSSGTYGVYIRFEYVDAESASRVFWNPTDDGSEYSQTVSTRREAQWSMRVELASPGSEWLQIGTADNSGGSLVIVDQRDLYFEGPVDGSYESGWSTEGGGDADDRDSDRQEYGVKDLRTFTQAMRQCVTDIRGRGLREWYEKGIGGLNVGFDDDPTEAEVRVGDADFGLHWESSSDVRLYFDDTDYLGYDRTDNAYAFYIGSISEAEIDSAGLRVLNGLYVGSLGTTPTDRCISADLDVIAGNSVYATTRFQFEGSNDWISNTDNTNMAFTVNSAEEMRLTADGLAVGNGLYVGSLGTTPTDRCISADLDVIAGQHVYAQSYFRFTGSNDFISNSDNTHMGFTVNDIEEMRITASGLAVRNGLYVGSLSGTPTDNDIYVEGDIEAATSVKAPNYYWTTNTYAVYSASSDWIRWVIDDQTEMVVEKDEGLYVLRGLKVGSSSGATEDDIRADADVIAGNSVYATTRFQFEGSNDWISNTDNTNMAFTVNSAEEMRLTADGLAVGNGLYVGSLTGTPTDNDITAAADVIAGGSVYAQTRFWFSGSNDFISNSDNTHMGFTVNDIEEMRITATGLSIENGLFIGDYTITPTSGRVTIQPGTASGRTAAGHLVIDDDTFALFEMLGGNPTIRFKSDEHGSDTSFASTDFDIDTAEPTYGQWTWNFNLWDGETGLLTPMMRIANINDTEVSKPTVGYVLANAFYGNYAILEDGYIRLDEVILEERSSNPTAPDHMFLRDIQPHRPRWSLGSTGQKAGYFRINEERISSTQFLNAISASETTIDICDFQADTLDDEVSFSIMFCGYVSSITGAPVNLTLNLYFNDIGGAGYQTIASATLVGVDPDERFVWRVWGNARDTNDIWVMTEIIWTNTAGVVTEHHILPTMATALTHTISSETELVLGGQTNTGTASIAINHREQVVG